MHIDKQKPLFNGALGRNKDLIRNLMALFIGAGGVSAGGYFAEDAAMVSDGDLRRFKEQFITEMRLEISNLQNSINQNQTNAFEKLEEKFHQEVREHVTDLHPK